ncbi:MAG: TA system VapC family ribonuclease toxin [Bryobacteraceae bacterium]
MLIPDVNILVYAHNSRAREHVQARDWWEKTLAAPRPVGMPWVTTLGFIRVVTHRQILENPMHVKDAIRRVRTWLDHPHVQILTPGDHHAKILFDLLEHLGSAGNLTTDAHLAALAIEYQAELVSADNDFGRFPRLRWFNPLQLK